MRACDVLLGEGRMMEVCAPREMCFHLFLHFSEFMLIMCHVPIPVSRELLIYSD